MLIIFASLFLSFCIYYITVRTICQYFWDKNIAQNLIDFWRKFCADCTIPGKSARLNRHRAAANI